MSGFSFSTPARARVALLGLALLAAPAPAGAQIPDCDALRQQMAAQSQADPGREARFGRAIEQQRNELARTQAYSDQIGCGGLGSFFGGAPPQCDAIANRVARMQNNLDQLQDQARTLRNGDPDRMAELSARYDTYCRGTSGNDGAIYTDPGLMQGDGSANIMTEGSEDQRPQAGGKAICVRTCDGGFFPLASSVRNSSLDTLQSLCSAQCPNTEAKLYTTPDTDDISGAVALDGTPYTQLPNAFKFQKAHDPACTCKPPNQTWVQALAKAEEMLDKTDTHDVVVTEKMSADMARPGQPNGAMAAPATKRPAKRRNTLVLPPPALPAPADLPPP